MVVVLDAVVAVKISRDEWIAVLCLLAAAALVVWGIWG